MTKQSAHLARADIHESIAELRFYRERLFTACDGVTTFAAALRPAARGARMLYSMRDMPKRNLLVSWRARPRGFVALMGLYESNYLRLSHLAGNLAALADRACSSVPGDCELLLEVVERAPTRPIADLTYLLPAAGTAAGDGAEADRLPDLRLQGLPRRPPGRGRVVAPGWRGGA